VRSLPLFPVVAVHRHVVYLCHETASMFTCAQLDRAEARASTCVPFIFNLRFKSRRAAYPRRASMLYSQISILKSAEQWRLFSVFNGHCASRSRGQQLSVFCPPPSSRASHIFAPVFARVLFSALTLIHNIQQQLKPKERRYQRFIN